MAWNGTNPVTVGAATKKDHYDRVFDNTLLLKTSISTDGTTWSGLVRGGSAGYNLIGSGALTEFLLTVRRDAGWGGTGATGVDMGNLVVGGNLTPGQNCSGYGLRVAPSFTEFAGGTHPLFASAGFIAPTITAGAGALTSAATVYIDAAPTGGATNYALYVASGDSIFGGPVASNATTDTTHLGLSIRNSSAGANAISRFRMGNATSVHALTIDLFGSGTSTPNVVSITNQLNAAMTFGTNGTERGRFASTGEFIVGKASTSSTVAGVILGPTGYVEATRASAYVGLFNRLTDDGQVVAFQQDSATHGSVSISGTTTSYLTTSDARLKDDAELTRDVSKLKTLSIYDYTDKKNRQPRRGVFAQDAFLTHPYAVLAGGDELDERGDPKNPWMVDYSKFVPDLIVGWQQHESRMESIEARLRALEPAA